MIKPPRQPIASPVTAPREPGQLISELLAAKHLRPRDIERKSRLIADARRNSGFYISHASLAAIRAGSTPSIYKVFSLAVCCGVSYDHLLSLFGIFADSHAPTVTSETTLEAALFDGPGFRFRMNFDIGVSTEETHLLPMENQDWQSLPMHLAGRLEPKRFLYAIVGDNDDSMAEIIPPGSLVEVDRDQTEVPCAGWRTLRERPVFLVWHDQGYSCVWCQMTKNHLFLIPHPVSVRPILQFRSPSEAVILGRIVHVWYSLGSGQP
jgi:hypothetical protein